MKTGIRFSMLLFGVAFGSGVAAAAEDDSAKLRHAHGRAAIDFTIRSTSSGNWSNAKTWQPARVPKQGDRVLVSRGTRVVYDVQSEAKIRLVQVVGILSFARDRDTLLNVGVLKVQNSNVCSEDGFACDFHDVSEAGEPVTAPSGHLPALEVGTLDNPIPPEHRRGSVCTISKAWTRTTLRRSRVVRRGWTYTERR